MSSRALRTRTRAPAAAARISTNARLEGPRLGFKASKASLGTASNRKRSKPELKREDEGILKKIADKDEARTENEVLDEPMSESELSELAESDFDDYIPPLKEEVPVSKKRSRKTVSSPQDKTLAEMNGNGRVQKRTRTVKKLKKEETDGEDEGDIKGRKTSKSKATPASSKRQKLMKYPAGTTPFPDHPHPTPEECKLVVDLLSSVHGPAVRPDKPPPPNLLVTGCGEVPSILDALVRTLLSANTNAKNSNTAFRGLIERFGLGEKGSVDWEKVRTADTKDVFEAIKAGGLANIKSARIKKILQQVWEENRERRMRKQEHEQSGTTAAADAAKETIIIKKEDGEIIKQESTNGTLDDDPTYNIDYDSSDDLSLDYLHLLTDDQVMTKLLSFDGIGFKTASCVMLFCMARESFAVDTHVFRLARFLNWVPPEKANRETTFWHLDAKIPDEYKYPLHALFIRHGRVCTWCKAGGPLKYEDAFNNAFPLLPADIDGNPKSKKGEGKVKVEIKEEGEEDYEDGEEVDEDFSEEEKPKKKGKKGGLVKKEAEEVSARCVLEDLVRRFHGTRKGKAKLEPME